MAPWGTTGGVGAGGTGGDGGPGGAGGCGGAALAQKLAVSFLVQPAQKRFRRRFRTSQLVLGM